MRPDLHLPVACAVILRANQRTGILACKTAAHVDQSLPLDQQRLAVVHEDELKIDLAAPGNWPWDTVAARAALRDQVVIIRGQHWAVVGRDQLRFLPADRLRLLRAEPLARRT